MPHHAVYDYDRNVSRVTGRGVICLNTCGVICLTLMTGWPGGRGEPGQEIHQPTAVVVPEMRPARSHDHGWIISDEMEPLPWKPASCPAAS